MDSFSEVKNENHIDIVDGEVNQTFIKQCKHKIIIMTVQPHRHLGFKLP